MEGLFNFLSPEAGQRRTKWLNDAINDNLSYFLGPTGIDSRISGVAEMNPINDIYRAGGDMRDGDYVGAAVNTATAAAPLAATPFLKGGGRAAAETLEDVLTGVSVGARGAGDAAWHFATDESGAVPLGGNNLNPAQQQAQDILDMLKRGRANEVTDDMMAASDDLYLFDNYDLPMDEASRMARAREMGFDTDAYHATRAADDFSVFKPGWRGSSYFAATPEDATAGAIGGASGSMKTIGQPISATLPVSLPGDEIARLRPSRAQWASLPEQAFIHNELELSQSVGGVMPDDVYDSVFSEGGELNITRRPFPEQQYARDVRNWNGDMLPGWNEGSDIPSLERVAQKSGQKGFLVSDEAGSSIVAGPDMPIRSRFARFDPRLAHLRNLSAGVGGISAYTAMTAEEKNKEKIRKYLKGGT